MGQGKERGNGLRQGNKLGQGKRFSLRIKEMFQKLSNFPRFKYKQILIEFKRILAKT
jgi:hypothetical protein